MQFTAALLLGCAAAALADTTSDAVVLTSYDTSTNVITTTDVDATRTTIPFETSTDVSPVETYTVYSTSKNTYLSGVYYTTTNSAGSTYVTSGSSNMAMATAAPMMGAIAMGALAFAL